MKKTIAIITLLISLNATAQTENMPSNIKVVDSIPPKQQPQLSDTSKFISVKDVNTAVEGIKDKITARQLEDFNLIWNYVAQTLSVEWQQKHTPKKK